MNTLLSILLWPVVYGIGLFVSCLPRALELRLGALLGRIFFLVDPKRRRIAEDNMRHCLTHLSAEQRLRLLKENYRHYGILALEIFHMFSPLPGHYARYTRRVTRLHGLEHWKKAHDKGKGVLFVSGHFANWELMVGIGALHGMPIMAVTRFLKPAWLHRKIESARLSVGVTATYQPRTLPHILKMLKSGGGVGMVMDQYAPPPMGMPTRFFGVMVNTLAAVGTLAQRTGAAIVPARQRREADGLVHITLEPEFILTPELQTPEASNEALAAMIERWVRDNPSQWLWLHRRFKNVVWPQDHSPI